MIKKIKILVMKILKDELAVIIGDMNALICGKKNAKL